MNIPNQKAVALHRAYSESTGINLPLNGAFPREYHWSRFMAKGWTEADLRLTVNYLKRSFPKYFLKMARFSRLIEDHAYFEEYLAMARADQRSYQANIKTNRDQALASLTTHSPESSRKQDAPKPAGMTAQAIVEGLQKWKRDNL